MRAWLRPMGPCNAGRPRVYAVLATGDPATAKMNEWLNGTPESNPFKRADTEMVSVEIKSVMPQTDSTWQVDWVETVRDRKGVMKGGPSGCVLLLPSIWCRRRQKNKCVKTPWDFRPGFFVDEASYER